MNILFDVSTIFLFFVTIPTNVDSKILRVGHEFNGYFSIVDANSRITRNKVKETTAKDLRKCTALCLIEKKCLTFNYNENLKICELLNISKFTEVGLLQSDEGWNHYETDDDEPNVGPFCTAAKPCPPYEVCEDTYESSKPYNCSCREGFTGVNCTGYEGPGSSSDKPIQSCNLLLSKYKDIKSGEYYIKKKGTAPVKRNCTRKETEADGSKEEAKNPVRSDRVINVEKSRVPKKDAKKSRRQGLQRKFTTKESFTLNETRYAEINQPLIKPSEQTY